MGVEVVLSRDAHAAQSSSTYIQPPPAKPPPPAVQRAKADDTCATDCYDTAERCGYSAYGNATKHDADVGDYEKNDYYYEKDYYVNWWKNDDSDKEYDYGSSGYKKIGYDGEYCARSSSDSSKYNYNDKRWSAWCSEGEGHYSAGDYDGHYKRARYTKTYSDERAWAWS